MVLPILLYNCGTWGLTRSNIENIDAFHRKHLRRILGIYWPETISNKDLYDRCRRQPISILIKRQRWTLLGHILRRDNAIPAQTAMAEYFKEGGEKYVGRTPTSLPTTLNQDLKQYRRYLDTTESDIISSKQRKTTIPKHLKTEQDLLELKTLAQDRETWRRVTHYIQTSK